MVEPRGQVIADLLLVAVVVEDRCIDLFERQRVELLSNLLGGVPTMDVFVQDGFNADPMATQPGVIRRKNEKIVLELHRGLLILSIDRT